MVNGANKVVKNTDDRQFTANQYLMRLLDIYKDCTSTKVRVPVETVKGIMSQIPEYRQAQEAIVGQPGNHKDAFLDAIYKFNYRDPEKPDSRAEHDKIKRYSWTKVSQDSPLDPLLPKRTVFYETPLKPEYFIRDPDYVANVANTLIDPFKRDFPASTPAYPPRGTVLTIDRSFFALFGFPNFSLTATIKDAKFTQFSYRIAYDDMVITDGTKGNFFFDGNDKIHGYIKNGVFPRTGGAIKSRRTQRVVRQRAPTKARTKRVIPKNSVNNVKVLKGERLTTTQKQFLLFLKEMGDVLQVLLMMAWYAEHPDEDYIMTTNDHPVFALCMLLNLNCSHFKKVGNKRCIFVFEGEEYTPEKAQARFNEVKQNTIKHNQELMEEIKKKRDAAVSINGYDDADTFELPSQFVEHMLADMEGIQKRLEQQQAPETTDTVKIDEAIKKLKKEHTLVHPFRTSKTSTKLMHNKEYCVHNVVNDTHFDRFKSKQTTLTLVDWMKHLLPSQRHRSMPAAKRRRIDGGGVSGSVFAFPQGAWYQEKDQDLDLAVDLYDELVSEIRGYLTPSMKPYFEEIYNALLYDFYFEDRALAGEALKTKIQEIWEKEVPTGMYMKRLKPSLVVDTHFELDVENPSSSTDSTSKAGFGTKNPNQRYSYNRTSKLKWPGAPRNLNRTSKNVPWSP